MASPRTSASVLYPWMVKAFATQAEYCSAFDAPFTVRLVQRLGQGIQAKPKSRLTEMLLAEASSSRRDWTEAQLTKACYALRVLAFLHRLAQDGTDAGLAAAFPSSALPRPLADVSALHDAAEDVAARVDDVVVQHAPLLQRYLAQTPQTNEPGRSVGILAGVLSGLASLGVSAAAPADVALLELGSSGGLNLALDRYRFDFGADIGAWGAGKDAASVVFRPEVKACEDGGDPKTLAHLVATVPASAVNVMVRRGCDIHPLDLDDAETRALLRSYVWADEQGRLERLTAALAMPHSDTVVKAIGAAEFLRQELPLPRSALPQQQQQQHRLVTIVYHSVMWMYMSPQEQQACLDELEAVGAAASPDQPLMHVAVEHDFQRGSPCYVHLTTWTGAGTRVSREVAHADNRGAWLRVLPTS